VVARPSGRVLAGAPSNRVTLKYPIGQIARLTPGKLRCDPGKERIPNQPEAEKLLSRQMRRPWKLA
jgi:hypothetical protein